MFVWSNILMLEKELLNASTLIVQQELSHIETRVDGSGITKITRLAYGELPIRVG
jgi:hypothetical protein